MIIKNWQRSIDAVVDWAEERGIEVQFGRNLEDQYIAEDKLIQISTAQCPENRFYTLLHECGHHLIFKTRRNFVRDMPMYAGFHAKDGRQERSKAYRVSLIAEEIDAWKRGRNLARRLNQTIDIKKYDKLMADCVYSYIKSFGY